MEQISLLDLVACVCNVIDLVSDVIKDHHNKVAYGAYYLTEAMGIKGEQKRDIIIAAALHDVGGLSLNDRLTAITLEFEDSNCHAEKGYRLLRDFEPFQNISDIVRNHHTPWNNGKAIDALENPIPLGSQIVLMADRIAVMLRPDINVLNQRKSVINTITRQKNSIYRPDLIAAFKKISNKDAFWLDIMSKNFNDSIKGKLKEDDISLSGANLTEALNLLSRIIDYRSFFTASHSKGVSVVARELSKLMDFSEEECFLMEVAGLLHDIGKLAVPSEIIEKQGPLNTNEKNIMHCHTYYTEKVLSHFNGFETIIQWASFHHENLDGSGYPFGIGEADLNLGARIMKVADVFTALMENRPYRPSMGLENSLNTLHTMVNKHELDRSVVDVLCENADHIDHVFQEESRQADLNYKKFLEGLEE